MEKRIMNDERSQLEAWGRLERTDLGQQQFDQARVCPDVAGLDPSPHFEALMKQRQRQQIVRNIMQQIIGESPYKPDIEWELFHRAQELEEQNAFPAGVTAFDVHLEYIRTWEGE